MPKFEVHMTTTEHDETILPGGFDTTAKAHHDGPLGAARAALREYFHYLDIDHPILALEKQDGPVFSFHVRDTRTKPMTIIARVQATVAAI